MRRRRGRRRRGMRRSRGGDGGGGGGGVADLRAVEGADVAVGGLLLDVGRDDGGVGDARGVQTVVGGHHVRGEPGGQKTV